MPYYFLFENLPPERPVGPLHGDYLPAKTTVPSYNEVTRQDPAGGIGGFLRRFLGSQSSAKSNPALADIGQILQEVGFLEITCRYDGGNDEGFAHFESASTADRCFTPNDAIDRLRGTRLGAVDYDPYAYLGKTTADDHDAWIARRSEMSEAERISEWLSDWFVQDIAVALLGEGFGTGEYAMEGRFRLDLRTGSISDLPMEPPPDFGNCNAFSLEDYYPEEEQR
jgi:hypothetical protein